MKNLFRKNNIIIAALAIMIIIAGYLNFSSKHDTPSASNTNDPNSTESAMGNDISDSDILSLDDQGNVLPESALGVTDSNKDASSDTASSKDTASTEDTASADGTKSTAKDTAKSDDKTAAADDKGTAKTADAKDNKETSTPGEAVLVSTTTTPDFFAASRIKREQWRSEYEQNYKDIINNETLTEETKQIAVNALLKLNKVKESENAAETLLEAKGFSDALVFMQDKRVDVVVNAQKITEQDLAKIMDIVKAETGMKATQIHVNPTIANE